MNYEFDKGLILCSTTSRQIATVNTSERNNTTSEAKAEGSDTSTNKRPRRRAAETGLSKRRDNMSPNSKRIMQSAQGKNIKGSSRVM